MFRKTYLEVNIDNLYHNYDLFITKTKKKMIAVIKANAYGLVDYEIARLLQDKGVDMFAVSSLDEAVRVRNHGINSNILIMGRVNQLDIVRENDFSIIIPDYDYIKQYKNELKEIKVHIKINTGLNRLGIVPNEASDVLRELLETNALVEGIMTHYACGDNKDYTNTQYQLFKETVEKLNYKFKYIHTAATDAALFLKDEISNYIRIGLGLFGYANIKHDWDFKPVISLNAEIVSCKKVKSGDGVSYGHHYISDGEGYIVTAAIGYADGIDRGLENKNVYIDDEECRVVGTVCMDLIMIHSNKPHKPGELVELIGKHISVEDMSDSLNSCCCKVLTSVSERVPRVYIKNNEVVNEINRINN